jgi:hypothetical protein
MEVHPWTQLGGGGISASCGIICLLFVLFMIYRLLSSSSEKKSNEDISILSKILKPQHIHLLSAILASISCIADAVKKLKYYDMETEQDICNISGKLYIAGYALSKLSTYAFLGAKALLVYHFETEKKIKGVKIFNLISLAVFAAVSIFAIDNASDFVNDLNTCYFRFQDKKAILYAYPAMDFIYSTMFGAVFIYPLRKFLKQTQDTPVILLSNNPNLHRTNPSKKFVNLLKETCIIGIIQIIVSQLVLIIIAIFSSNPGGISAGFLTGSFSSIDLLTNIILQTYSTRNAWFKKNKNMENKMALDSSSKQNNQQIHSEEMSAPLL